MGRDLLPYLLIQVDFAFFDLKNPRLFSILISSLSQFSSLI